MNTTKSEILIPGPAEGLAGLLDASDVAVGEGDALPLLWHWVYLLERPASRELGPDGHPLGGLASPPPGSRRMWAGGRVSAHRPLVLGRRASRTSEVVDRRQREGRSGPLTFVTLRHQISQDGHLAVEEWQDVVYRRPASGPPARPDGSGGPSGGPEGSAGLSARPDGSAGLSARPDGSAGHSARPDGSAGLSAQPAGVTVSRSEADSGRYSPPAPDTVTLFRMSALTYNSHRIHYDRDYVRDVEGYPDLVVHGPLQALYMAEVARRRLPDGIAGLTSCSYRMTSPLVLGAGLQIEVKARPNGADVTIVNGSGVVTSSGAFEWQAPASS